MGFLIISPITGILSGIMNRITILIALLLSLVITNSAYSDGLLITGADMTSESTNYLFIGGLIPLPGSSLAHGFVLHLWADHIEYSYESGPDNIDAKGKSVSTAVAYHDSGSGYWWNAKIGGVLSNTRLKPDDPENDARGNSSDLKLGLSGEYHLTSLFKVNGIADYGVDRKSYWVRGRLLRKVSDHIYTGPEIINQGDPSYEIKQFGWAVEGIPVKKNTSLGIKAGRSDDGSSDSLYVGIDMVVFF